MIIWISAKPDWQGNQSFPMIGWIGCYGRKCKETDIINQNILNKWAERKPVFCQFIFILFYILSLVLLSLYKILLFLLISFYTSQKGNTSFHEACRQPTSEICSLLLETARERQELDSMINLENKVFIYLSIFQHCARLRHKASCRLYILTY